MRGTAWGVWLLAVVSCSSGASSGPEALKPELATASARVPQAGSPGPFTGLWIPEPPQQAAPWDPGTPALPAKLVSTTLMLFAHGMADPRGLEYREAEIHVGSVWQGDGGIAKTHAWILPETQGSTGPRFAVAWNGLVYPVSSVGNKQDLQADVRALVKADEERRAKHAKDNPGHEFYRFRQAWPEADSVAHTSLKPGKVPLLLRLGEHALAKLAWDAWTVGMRENTNDDKTHIGDPYLMLATDWVWALFDRAVCAHMRADDALALASAKALTKLEKLVEAEADARGFPKRGRDPADPGRHFHFLAPLPELLADQERRASAAGAPAQSPEALQDQRARIAQLIASLDQVSARQWSQPGGVTLGEDARVKALIKEGDAAVEPLLAALEGDTRLTRSVHFWRDFSHSRSLLGVHEAAYVALSGILDARFFGAVSTGDNLSARGLEGRREVAGKIRAYWAKWKGVPLEERWYRVLLDDASPEDHWLEAARNITQPGNVAVVPGSTVFTSEVTSPAGPTPPGLRGEPLRAKTGPTVTEALSRRVDVLAAKGDGNALVRACSMALATAAWDPKGALPALSRQAERSRLYHVAHRGDRAHETSLVARCLAQIAAARGAAGDMAGVDVYASWVVGITPEDVDWYPQEVFEPMWRFPEHAGIQRAAEALFGDPKSPWTRIAESHQRSELLEIPLVRVPAFQRLVLRELTNKSVVGSVEVREDGHAKYTAPGGANGSVGLEKGDAFAPRPGTKHTLRVCDFVAWRLQERSFRGASNQGVPVFRIYWPESKRDEALRSVAAYVKAQSPQAAKKP